MTRLLLLASAIMIMTFSNCQDAPAPASQTPPAVEKPALPPHLVFPEWAKNAVLYELNTRQFSPDGNFAGVTAQLPRLKELGVDIIWLMPIHPVGKERRKGSLGSPYSVQDYYAVNPDLGTLDDLKSLINAAHQSGMKVILDWVPNHTSWDAVWKQQHPEYYSRYKGDFTVPFNEHGEPIADWQDVCDLDYNQPEMRKAMVNAMQYWVKTTDIDGFRCDMAGLVPNDFWTELRPALDTIKPMFMLAEWQDEKAHFNSCFHVNYGWKWKDITKDIWAGKQNAQSLDTLKNFLDQFYPASYCQLYFTQNHDENSWSGAETELYGASAEVMNVLAWTWGGIPMIYSGQEAGNERRLRFFDRDPIRWKKHSRNLFFQRLNDLRHQNQALWSGDFGGEMVKFNSSDEQRIYAFGREKNGDKVVIITNLSKQIRTASVTIPADFSGGYANVFANNTMQLTAGELRFTLKPWEYIVLTNK